MKTATFIFTLLIAGSLSAQSWCPPGAQWWHRYGDFYSTGYYHSTYVQDTTINGYQCQKIDVNISAYNLMTQTPWTPTSEARYTTIDTSGGAYWVLSFPSGALTPTDTLFNLNAEIGDTWGLKDCAASRWEALVLDTGHMTIDGLSLRYLITALTVPGGGFTSQDTVIERIGSLSFGFMPEIAEPLCVEPYLWGTRCYSDDDISVTYTPDPCNFIVGISENVMPQHVLTLYPDPVIDIATFHITETRETMELLLFDARGVSIGAYKISGQLTLDLSKIPAGPYFFRLIDPQGELHDAGSWIKL